MVQSRTEVLRRTEIPPGLCPASFKNSSKEGDIMIGKSIPRVDAYEKVTGRAQFTDDMAPKNCLVAKVYHATIGNGIVTSIDTSAVSYTHLPS